jgi:hypothetical protein
MQMLTDPPPCLNLDIPEVWAALVRIRLELDQISRDELFMTPRERLQEARARAAPTVVAALDAMDGWRRVRDGCDRGR